MLLGDKIVQADMKAGQAQLEEKLEKLVEKLVAQISESTT